MDSLLLDKSDDFGEVLEVVDVKNLPTYVSVQNERLEDDLPLADMTSLGDYMLLGRNIATADAAESLNDQDADLSRVSLAYERLRAMPRILVEELGPTVRILDVSNNELSSLEFLGEFKQLTSLICDRNEITSQTHLPHMPKLELLWLNHCKIKELHPWARKLRFSCPNLKYLSLMGNPAAPSYLNSCDFYEYVEYRCFMISLFPKLLHLDDAAVTETQRIEAERQYRRPIAEKLLFTGKYLPEYFREMSEKVSDLFTPSPRFVVEQRNVMI